MKTTLLTILLLVVSNIFMTVAWYGHLKLHDLGIMKNWPLFAVILLSWGVALLEYCFMIPANKMGFSGNGGPFTLMQLKAVSYTHLGEGTLCQERRCRSQDQRGTSLLICRR